MTEKEVKKKEKHILTKKVPLLAILLWCVFDLFLIGIVLGFLWAAGVSADVFGENTINNTAMIIGSVLFMIIMRLWYSPEYKGILKSALTHKLTLTLMIPALLVCLATCIIQLIQYHFWFDPSVYNAVKALTAGFGEEVLFRVTVIPIAMGFFRSEKRVFYIPVISGLIFGVLHLVNIDSGATVTNSIVQAVCAGMTGIYYGALFVMTGSAFPGIFLHTLYDFICFAGDASLTNGVMTGQIAAWEMIYNVLFSAALMVIAFAALKKLDTPKILQIWKEKWSRE